MAFSSRSSDSSDPMLALGRLDGRLHHSPGADIFHARARLEGAVTLASLAGVPVRIEELQSWIAGRSPPPRASEGGNDPISVTAIFHLALTRDEDSSDPIVRATLNVLRTILDDRAAAQTYGGEDLAYFGPMWRQVRAMAERPFANGQLIEIAERIFEMAKQTEPDLQAEYRVVTVDGRTFDFASRERDRNWLLALTVPAMLMRAGLTSRVIPSLILLPKFLPPSPALLAEHLRQEVGQIAHAGLHSLASIERSVMQLPGRMLVTKRSKSPLLARLQLVYPDLQPAAVSRLLQVTPQGARKLLNGLKASAPLVQA